MVDLTEKKELEATLGFGKSPRRRSVYVNRQYDNCLWYFWDGAKSAHEPIEASDLFCLIQSVAIKESEFKGKLVEKIEINVQSDEKYRLLAGIDTAFCKSIVSNLLYCDFNFLEPVSILVKAGDEEGVVFGRVYQDGILTSTENPQIKTVEDVKAAIAVINDRLLGKIAELAHPVLDAAVEFSTATRMEKTVIASVAESSNLTRLAQIREWTGHAKAQVKAIAERLDLKIQDAAKWAEKDCNVFFYAMLVDWSMTQSVFESVNHAESALDSLIIEDAPDSQLWEEWQEEIARRKAELLESEASDQSEAEDEQGLDKDGNPF